MIENASTHITGSDDNCLLGFTEAAHKTTVPLTIKQKTLLKAYLLIYRQFLYGYGKSCVGSVGLSAGFSLELVDALIERACELTSIDTVKSKPPLFDHDHKYDILNS